MAVFKLINNKAELEDKHLILHKWDRESFLKIKSPIPHVSVVEEAKAKSIDKGHGVVKRVSNFKQADKDKEVHIYEKKPVITNSDEDIEDIEYEVHFKKKPESNVIELDIDHSGDLDFFFQPEQPPKPGIQTDPFIINEYGEKVNPDSGEPWDPTELDYGEQNGGDIWPEVINSYAVYHKVKKGGKYRSGKAFNIYRPKTFDIDGNWVWCEIYIDEARGKLQITIPQKFLDDAKYPIIVDPTFGNTTNPTSASVSIESVIAGSVFAANFIGNVTLLSMYTNPSSTSRTYSGAVYLYSDLSLVAGETAVTPATGLAWRDVTMSPVAAVTNGTDYILCAWGSNSSGTHVIWYDTGSTGQGQTDSDSGSFTWPNPLVPTASTRLYGIHADGTETAYSVSTYDNIKVAEYDDSFSPTCKLDVYENVSASESNTGFPPLYFVDSYDRFTIIEYIEKEKVEGALSVSINDKLGVAEYQDKLVTIYYLSLYDPLGVAEYTDRFPTKYNLSLYDSFTVSEFVDKVLTIYYIDKYDGLTVQEYQGKLIPSYIIDRYDAASVQESIDKLLPKYFLEKFDSISVQEYINAEFPSASSYTLSKEDLATIVEFIALTHVFNINEY